MVIVTKQQSMNVASIKSKDTSDDADVPKITVFKSPPWNKPLIQPPTPKITDVFEEFPSKTKLLPRRYSMSHSLECIPENTILYDIAKSSTPSQRESNRLSPHQVLPPIPRNDDDDLPEMRARAYSDPHRYTTILKKKIEERKESPLVKRVSITVPNPPKTKVDDNSHNASLDRKSHRQIYSKESTPNKITGKQTKKTTTLQGESITAITKGPTPVSTPDTPTRKLKPPHPKPPRKPKGNGAVKPVTNKSSVPSETCPHPSVLALRKSEARSRTNSLPGSLSMKTSLRRTHSPVINSDKEFKKSVAYALIGSPGRNRWPSPDRNSSSFVNSDDAESAESDGLSTGSSNEAVNDSSRGQNLHLKDIDNHASDEFKSILKDFRGNSPDTSNYKVYG